MRLCSSAGELYGVSSYWSGSMERANALKMWYFYSVHAVSLMPKRWLNHWPTRCDALLPPDDRILRQSATVWRCCPRRAEPSKPDSSASWICPWRAVMVARNYRPTQSSWLKQEG